MASGVTRVIERCDNAVETEKLDLSECQLVQLPDAIFHLMRNTTVREFNLSGNLITRIAAKLAQKFSALTTLNLSYNRIGKLPEELSQLTELQHLNISHNALLTFPSAVYTLPNLETVNLMKNYIEDIDGNRIKNHGKLKLLDVQDNPLSTETRSQLSTITSVKIQLSPPAAQEEWEIIPDS